MYIYYLAMNESQVASENKSVMMNGRADLSNLIMNAPLEKIVN